MDRKNIYLDYAATCPLSETVKESIISMLDIYGNPSSLHKLGTQAKQVLSEARKSVAEFINADVEDIYFTPGGAASNTFGIRGYYQKHDCCIRMTFSGRETKEGLDYVCRKLSECVESLRSLNTP